MQIETHRFEFSHGKRPSGTGTWVFKFLVPQPVGPALAFEEFAPRPMLYSAAKRWANARAKALKASRVLVCE